MANYAHYNGNGSNKVAANPVRLKSVTINTKGATANTLTLYDNALGDNSGTVIAAIDTTAAVAYFPYDVLTQKGLSAILAAGTAADVTIAFE